MKLIRTQRLLIGILFGLVGIGLVLGIGGSLREIVSAQGMNTVVFTGQVIPAYEGAAYDPTVAYQYLSGLPIYVFVYDNWRPGGGDDWVVNNLVVRTQIRADGTFQVMGLPHGANFGVYFPFQEICYSGANYTGSVVECWGTPATRRVERADGLSTPPLIAPFRSPWLQRTGRTDFAGVLSVPGQEYGDGIADVFSYGFLECSIDDVGGNMEDCHSVTAYDQFGQEIVIQEEFVFITSTNRLDIQSHINVFPLIPATVLNVSMRLCDQIKGVGYFSCGDGGNMELHAERVVRRAYPKEYRILYEDADCTESGTGYTCEGETYITDAIDHIDDSCRIGSACEELFVPSQSLVVKGRSTRVLDSTLYTAHFRSFAPPGVYAVTVWRSGEGASFQSYGGHNSVLGTNFYDAVFAFVDNTSDSHWGETRRDAGGPELWAVQSGQALVTLGNTKSFVWGRVISEESVSGTWGRALSITRDGITLSYDTIATAGDFEYDAPSVTNVYGIFSYRSPANTEDHGFKVGVNHPGYLQTEDAVYVTSVSGPRRTQDFILREPASTGYQIYVGIGGAGGVSRGANGVTVSTLCSSCPFARGSRQELSAYRGRTGYEGHLTQTRPGYFYLSAGWFKEDEDYAVTFSTSSLTAVCQLDRSAISAMKAYSGNQPLDMIGDCWAFPTGSSGPVTFIDGSSATGIVLQERPSSLVGFFPNLHIPNAFAQEINVLCDASSPLYCVAEDRAAGCPCAECIVLPGTYGGGAGEEYGSWDPTIIASVSGVSCVAMTASKAGVGSVGSAVLQTIANVSGTIAGLTAAPTAGLSLDVLDALTTCSFGEVEENVEEQAFTWQIPCETLGAIGDDITVRVSAILEEAEGTGMAVGEVDVEIKAVTTGGVLSGFEFSDLSPDILIQPDCPRAENLIFEGAEAVETWGPHYMCVITKGIASATPQIFGWLERTMLHTEALTESPAVVAIWNHMRNVANVFTLITLLVIGFMTILRVNPREFQPGSALGALLVSLVFINFSLLLCEVFIDLNNALVVYVFDVFEGVISALAEQGMTTGGGSGAFVAVGGMGAALGGALISVMATSIAATGGVSAGGIGAGLAVMVVSIATALMGILLAFLILYMVRYGVIWLCVIMAPLVFFLNNIPMFKGEIRKKWFQLFFGFTFIQTMAAIIIGVGMALLLGLSPESGIWQSVRQLLIAIAVLYLGTKSPSTILGMFGLDMATGSMIGQAGKMAEPLQKKIGGIKEGWGTTEGIGERLSEGAERVAHYRSEGKKGLGLAARRIVGAVPGLAGLQTAAIKAQQKTIKAKAAGTESGVAGIWDDAEVPKWKVGGLMRAYSNIGDKVGLVNRERKAVLGGVNMGDMRAATGNNSRNFVKAFGGDEPPEGSAPWKTIAYRRRVGATVNAVMDAKAERKLKDEGSSTKTLKGRLRLRELKRQERVDLIAQYGGLEDPSKAGQEYWAHGVSYAALEAANKEMQGTVVGKGDLAAYRELGDKDYTPEGGKKGGGGESEAVKGGGESGGGGRKLAAKILTPAGTSKRRQTPEGGKLG